MKKPMAYYIKELLFHFVKLLFLSKRGHPIRMTSDFYNVIANFLLSNADNRAFLFGARASLKFETQNILTQELIC